FFSDELVTSTELQFYPEFRRGPPRCAGENHRVNLLRVHAYNLVVGMSLAKNLAFAVIPLLLCCPTALPQGEVAPPRPRQRIVTRTRLVAIFSDLENQL